MISLKHKSFEQIEIDGRIIRGDVSSPESQTNKYPAVIIMHGFKASKDWGFFPYLRKSLAECGAIAIAFSFSHCGYSTSNLSSIDIESFRSDNLSDSISEAKSVIELLRSGSLPNSENWDGRIFLVGHSRGGAISLICAAEDKHISGIALYGTISRLNRYTDRQTNIWKVSGTWEFSSNETGQKLFIDRKYLDDLELNEERYDLKKRASEISCPVLIVHGNKDFTVKMKEPNDIFKSLPVTGIKKLMHIIDKTGHTFGIRHPFEQTTPALEELINSTNTFFEFK